MTHSTVSSTQTISTLSPLGSICSNHSTTNHNCFKRVQVEVFAQEIVEIACRQCGEAGQICSCVHAAVENSGSQV